MFRKMLNWLEKECGSRAAMRWFLALMIILTLELTAIGWMQWSMKKDLREIKGMTDSIRITQLEEKESRGWQ